MSKKMVLTVAAAALVAGGVAYYAPAVWRGHPSDSASVERAVTTAAAPKKSLIFTAPPRETPEAGEKLYGPIAEYLSKVTGKRIVYKHPGTWGVYRTEMLNDAYDLVFDGPHFNSYRAAKLNHNIVAKLAIAHQFMIITHKDEKISSAAGLIGRTFCGEAPPNLGTLTALMEYPDPAKQPVLVPTHGWKNIYDGVISGRCVGGVLPVANLKKFNKDGAAKVVFSAKPTPNQAFSAGPRISAEDQAKIAAALIAPEASEPTAKLRERFKAGETLVAANNAEYAGVSEILRNEWGFFDNEKFNNKM